MTRYRYVVTWKQLGLILLSLLLFSIGILIICSTWNMDCYSNWESCHSITENIGVVTVIFFTFSLMVFALGLFIHGICEESKMVGVK